MKKILFYIILMLFLTMFSESFSEIQRMGIMPGEITLNQNESGFLESRCLDREADPPTSDEFYTKTLSDNQHDISVRIGTEDLFTMDQAISDSRICITGYSPNTAGKIAYTDKLRVKNLTKETISISVNRFTPVGKDYHNTIGFDITEFQDLNQKELWYQFTEKDHEVKVKIQEDRFGKDSEHNKVIPGKEIVNSIGMKLRLIPSGLFMMGSPENSSAMFDVFPQHKVTITKSFYIGVYEVTSLEFFKVMGKKPINDYGDYNPARSVSWKTASEFCRKLSNKEPGRKYRLPTEAEWEYACRAGNQTDYFWIWDNEMDKLLYIDEYACVKRRSQAEYFHHYGNQPSYSRNKVGTKKPNRWGLYDMSGNLSEWCSDWYDSKYYSVSPEKDPTGPENGKMRIHRGGSYNSIPSSCRTSKRGRFFPLESHREIGFRVCLEIEE
jgi:formylglycine-generating enzyme required for sulfatase activity